MEELNLEFGLNDLEVIERLNNQTVFPFPVVHASKSMLIFNSLAEEHLPTSAWIKWFASTEYIVGMPAKPSERNAFKIAYPTARRHCLTARFPDAMAKDRGLKEGYYKLFKYKDGIAFKRYEPLQA